MTKAFPLTLMFSGIFLLGVIVIPIGLSQINYNLRPKLLDPTAVSGNPIFIASNILGASTDYTDSATWFENFPQKQMVTSRIGYYKLSIPRLGIKDTPVEINGTDLKKNPIHFSGTAIPGTYGNTVIFGHSTLAQLYRPGDPVSIFNPLLKARLGDEVTINYDGITYRYLVRFIKEVEPTEIEVLAQRYDKHELTLITCVPLGTYLRRFVVRAELIN